MNRYRYKKSHALIIIIFYLFFIICLFIYTIWGGYISAIKTACVLLPPLIVYVIYCQIKFDRMYDVYTDSEKIIVTISKGWVSEETSMLWEDITIISCFRSYIIFKELYIATKHKSVTLKIRNFKNYEEMLKTILEKTKKNEKIKIEQAVYDMIK